MIHVRLAKEAREMKYMISHSTLSIHRAPAEMLIRRVIGPAQSGAKYKRVHVGRSEEQTAYALRPRRRSRLPHITRPSRLAARRSACGACEVRGCIESENADQ